MRSLSLMLPLLCGLVLLGPSAHAGDLRWPANGNPALTFQIPDDWTTSPDDNGNLVVTAAGHESALSISVADFGSAIEPDEVASMSLKAAKAAPPVRVGPTEMSGYAGIEYSSTMVNGAGVDLKLRLLVIKIAPSRFAACTVIEKADITPSNRALDASVVKGMQIVK